MSSSQAAGSSSSSGTYEKVSQDSESVEDEQGDIEAQKELLQSLAWHGDASWLTRFGRTIEQLTWAARITLCCTIIFAALLLFLQSLAFSRHGIQIVTHFSVPEILNALPWDSAMSSLSDQDLSSNGLYPKSLGKSVLMLDVDTRPWNEEDPTDLSQLTWGRLNHYLYARMHGYDYEYVRATPTNDVLHATWGKVLAIRAKLQSQHRFIVFTDSDVIFPHLKLPLERMLDHWNVTSDIAVAMSVAQDLGSNRDRTHNRTILNSGFIVVQNTPVAHAMFADWDECTSDVKFADCSFWGREPWHEQSAYSDYIRYAYPGRTRELACGEANGAPQHALTGERHCGGELVRHYWMAKEEVRGAVQAAVGEVVLPTAVEDLRRGWMRRAG